MEEKRYPEDETSLPAGRLERWIGRPPREWTLDDLLEVVRDRRVRLVSLLHVGGDGQLKGLDFAPRSLTHLEDVLLGGERADGSSLFPGTGLKPTSSDIVLRPRLNRAFLDPFSPLPTLAVLCGHQVRKGAPLPQSPDTIVRFGFERLREQLGVELWALGEVEYFLGRRPADGEAWGKAERGYHTTSPFVFGEDLRREALATLASIGVPLKYAHSEVGCIEAGEKRSEIWEQHEIEMGLAPLPDAADDIVLSRWVLMKLADRRGMRLSFDPIVRVGHAGSGLHFHFSPVVGAEHVGCRDEKGVLSDPAKWLIAGLVRLGGALMAFGNRSDGSFIRLSQGKEAPNAVTWGDFDRHALVRLPIYVRTAEGRLTSPPTIEFRLPDGSAHPHHLLAGVAQALVYASTLEDVDEVLARTASDRARAQPDAQTTVPRSFPDVVAAVRRHRAALEAGGVFPAEVIDEAIRGRPV